MRLLHVVLNRLKFQFYRCRIHARLTGKQQYLAYAPYSKFMSQNVQEGKCFSLSRQNNSLKKSLCLINAIQQIRLSYVTLRVDNQLKGQTQATTRINLSHI